MDKLDIVGMNYTFDIYLNKVITISETCPREINYQLEIIKPFLESVFKDYQIVDTSSNSKPRKSTNKPKHNRFIYTIEDGTAPDLLIAKGYKYENNKEGGVKTQIYGLIEVKSQANSEMFNKDFDSYDIHIINEITTYFCKNEKVILTNCRRWQFFDRNKIKNIDLDLFKKYLILAQNYFYINEDKVNQENIDNLFKEIKENSHNTITKLVNPIEATAECFFKCKETLESYIRNQISTSIVNTIDVLPNKGVVKTDMYEETNIIKAPAEWNEMIRYLKEFVLNEV
ncbi:hypothetical protein SAMN02745163_02642 [Clostridium cavendishii DSM 21758]|uniref:Uncharacterized protein n=1 Tax=Clostridium cavendishii DSM 21758 TaxID=1121302 RepID=A0A1M6MI10_9CLOT|nr:hypothetical protein [Clostridium cavendishii]SHJ83036.1 hypothetical protein SAMN02745163_02642 [Clostridium cavendishii DSM 21758]